MVTGAAVSGTDVRPGRWLDLVGEVLRQPLAELPHRELHTELAATFDACATRVEVIPSSDLRLAAPSTWTTTEEELGVCCWDWLRDWCSVWT